MVQFENKWSNEYCCGQHFGYITKRFWVQFPIRSDAKKSANDMIL